MNFGARIQLAREHMNWRQGQLATLSGVAQETLSALETRGSNRSNYSEALISAFPPERISHEWLRSEKGSMIPVVDAAHHTGGKPGSYSQTPIRTPVVGTAKLGMDGYFEELSTIPGAGDGFLQIMLTDVNAYALRCRGMSMFPAIRDNWFVVISPRRQPAEGEYVLIKLTDGRKTIKELLFQRSGSIELLATNGGERISIDRTDITDIQAVGAILPPSVWVPD